MNWLLTQNNRLINMAHLVSIDAGKYVADQDVSRLCAVGTLEGIGAVMIGDYPTLEEARLAQKYIQGMMAQGRPLVIVPKAGFAQPRTLAAKQAEAFDVVAGFAATLAPRERPPDPFDELACLTCDGSGRVPIGDSGNSELEKVCPECGPDFR